MKRIDIGTIVVDDNNNQYSIIDEVGSGGFSRVYKATCNGGFYGIKVLDHFDSKSIYSLKNEFDIASRVASDHAIKYYYLNEHGHNDYPCFIVMEFADGGSLEDELKTLERIGASYPSEKLFDIYIQLIDGMIDISQEAVHRDIKPANILKSNGKYKISDYGLSKYINEATRSASKTMKGYGTKEYYAPELWANPGEHGLNNIQVDIYAMGIVFYQIANNRYPYNDTGDYRTMHMTAAINPFNSNVDTVFQNLINKMMAKSTTERFKSWEEIKKFLSESDAGKCGSRDAFVDLLLKDSAMRKQSIDSKVAKQTKEENERIEAFRRLISLIQSKIYNPLMQIVDSFNRNTANGKLKLSNIEINDEEETFSFQYTVEPLSEDEDEREISFCFMTTPIEETQPLRVIPTTVYYDEDDKNELLNNIINPNPRIIEYKYLKSKILLWGVIQADCGVGINVAILDNPADPLYGVLKVFLRVPNIHGWNYWIPIETKEQLKSVCPYFREYNYSTKVEDFEFNVIKTLIQFNITFSYGQIKDPNGNGLIAKLY